jgi:hypothetical protein
MIVCIPHAKVGYRQAIHRNPGLERAPGFFVYGCNLEFLSYDRAARGVERRSHDDPAPEAMHRPQCRRRLAPLLLALPVGRLNSHRRGEMPRRKPRSSQKVMRDRRAVSSAAQRTRRERGLGGLP